MAIAKRHRAALVAAGEENPPAMLDVTVSILIVHRKHKDGVDFEWLLSLKDADLIARVGFIHNNIDRKTGQVAIDLFAPPKGENA